MGPISLLLSAFSNPKRKRSKFRNGSFDETYIIGLILSL
nr:MAG TPA: hypothetical protein [Caudoviricetes sp.]